MRSKIPGEVVEWLPNICVNGHRLIPPNVDVAWLPCSCAKGPGHRTVSCRTCRHTWYLPPHEDDGKSATNWH